MNSAGNALEDLVYRFIATVAVVMPDDVSNKLLKLARMENSPYGKIIYNAVLRNNELARSRKLPLCQDTGTPEFQVAFGEGFKHKEELLAAIRKAVAKATLNGFLRPNAVDPVYNKNTGDNTGRILPWIDVELVPQSSDAVVQLYLAGGGSTRASGAVVLDPADGWEGVFRFVLELIAERGMYACPPLMVLGVGVGPTISIAAKLSKKALLRPLGARSPDPWVSEMELALEKAINKLGIGPQGLGGAVSVGEVHIEYGERHPASMALAVTTSCWALRKGQLVIRNDYSFDVTTHKGGLIDA
jgi:L(+)-tartrate dehydratase alpha subunit